MLRTASVSATGNEEVANYAVALMQDRGLKAQMQPVTHSLENVTKRQFNAIGILGDPLVDRKTKKGLLLTSHLDTGGPGLPENWSELAGEPFNPQTKEGRLFGLGAADAKVDFLCKLRAVERFRERKLRMPVYLVGSCGEELGMFGARYLIKSLALNPKYVVVGEPTGLELALSHKAQAVYRVSIGYQLVERDARGFNRRIDLYSFGRTAHGAFPDQGTNALLQAVDFLQEATENGFELRFTKLEGGESVNRVPDRALAEFYLTSHQFEDFKRFFRDSVRQRGKEKAFRVELGGLGDMGVRFLPEPLFPALWDVVRFFREIGSRFAASQEPGFDPGHSTVNFGQVQQRLGGMDLFLDLRVLPTHDLEKLEREIQEGAHAIASRHPSLNLTITRERVTPGVRGAEEQELVQLCKKAMRETGLEEKLARSSIVTEVALYRQAGFEAVAFGPGQAKGNTHGPNESILLAEMEKAVMFYERLIERACT